MTHLHRHAAFCSLNIALDFTKRYCTNHLNIYKFYITKDTRVAQILERYYRLYSHKSQITALIPTAPVFEFKLGTVRNIKQYLEIL